MMNLLQAALVARIIGKEEYDIARKSRMCANCFHSGYSSEYCKCEDILGHRSPKWELFKEESSKNNLLERPNNLA